MAVSKAFVEHVLDQLEQVGGVTSRRMFGGVGLYCREAFFAIVDDDTLYFKVNDETRPEYESRGAMPFRPYKNRPQVSLGYFSVPADVMDDREELAKWARRSVQVVLSTPRGGGRRK